MSVRDMKDGKVYKATVVDVDDEQQTLKVHYVG